MFPFSSVIQAFLCLYPIPSIAPSQHKCFCLLAIIALYYLEDEQQKAFRHLLLLFLIHLNTGSSGLSAHLPLGSISPLQTCQIRSDGRYTLKNTLTIFGTGPLRVKSSGGAFLSLKERKKNFQEKRFQINNSLKLLHVIEKNINGNES